MVTSKLKDPSTASAKATMPNDAEQAGDGAATPRSRREWAGRVADTRANRATDSRDAVDDPYASDNGSERKR
jgi:hypothetical protein